jgi:hypothetical protein
MEPWNSSTVTGNYPVVLLYLNNSTAACQCILTLWLQGEVVSYSFNSVTKLPGALNNGNSTIEMSEHPSYSTRNFTVDNDNAAEWATNNDEIAMIYIPNTTIHVTNYAVYYVWEENAQCYDKFLGYETTIKIATVNMTDFPLRALGTNESYWDWSVQNVFRMSPFVQTNVQPAQVLNMTALLLQATGYSAASSALQKALDASGVFESALGLGLDIMDASSIMPKGSETADIASTIALLNDQIGSAISAIFAFSSIGYSYNFSYATYGSANGPPFYAYPHGFVFNLTIYQSNYTGELDIGGTYYYVNMPSYFFYVLAKPA